MPGATEDEITRLEKNIGAMPGITTLLQQGKSIPDILNMALDGFNPELLDSTRIDYCCDCSLDRVERTIRSLGKKRGGKNCAMKTPLPRSTASFAANSTK